MQEILLNNDSENISLSVAGEKLTEREEDELNMIEQN